MIKFQEKFRDFIIKKLKVLTTYRIVLQKYESPNMKFMNAICSIKHNINSFMNAKSITVQ